MDSIFNEDNNKLLIQTSCSESVPNITNGDSVELFKTLIQINLGIKVDDLKVKILQNNEAMEKIVRQSMSLKETLNPTTKIVPFEEVINYVAGSYSNGRLINMVQSNDHYNPQTQTKYPSHSQNNRHWSSNYNNNNKSLRNESSKGNANGGVLMLTATEDPIGRIHGIAIMNGIKISYLCDSVADESFFN
ncbi:unnamed protein product [Brachionus calyciflorus]|uniref:Uncharacterized protein n=1 Tax=Brachionus calyciflorus TaxID=104777 RepID=A0A813V6F6_9BILA|nr:unnamed protein product [Brachionus calyciflorus]